MEISSSNFTVSKSAGSLIVTLVISGDTSRTFIAAVIAEVDNSSNLNAKGSHTCVN